MSSVNSKTKFYPDSQTDTETTLNISLQKTINCSKGQRHAYILDGGVLERTKECYL